MSRKIKSVSVAGSGDDNSLAEYMGHELFSPEEEAAAFEKLQRVAEKQGKDSPEWISVRNDIIQHNYRLVAKETLKFKRILPATMQLKECFSAGCLGLIWAIEKYDLGFGTRFSTYAVPWIGRAIRSEISTYDALSRSTRVLGDVRKIVACAQNYETTFGEPPATEKLAELTGLSTNTLSDRISSMGVVLSLDAKVDEDEEDSPTLRDIIPCQDDVEQNVEDRLEYTAALEAMAIILNDMCQDIIKRHCGIGCQSESYDSIARTYGCTRTHISNCERKALTALQYYLQTGLLPIPKRRGPNYGKK